MLAFSKRDKLREGQPDPTVWKKSAEGKVGDDQAELFRHSNPKGGGNR